MSGHNWNTQLQSITAVNVCSNPRVKANKLFNKKLYPGPNMLSLYPKRPESHCEGQCAAVVPAGTGSSCVKRSTPVAMGWTVGFVFIGGTVDVHTSLVRACQSHA